MQYRNVTVVVNYEVPEDQVEQVKQELRATLAGESKSVVIAGMEYFPGAVLVLEGLAFQVSFGPEAPPTDPVRDYLEELGHHAGTGGRPIVASPHGPLRGPSLADLDAADRGEFQVDSGHGGL